MIASTLNEGRAHVMIMRPISHREVGSLFERNQTIKDFIKDHMINNVFNEVKYEETNSTTALSVHYSNY